MRKVTEFEGERCEQTHLTKHRVKVWKSWASLMGYDESIEKYEPDPEQNLRAVLRNRDDHYEPDSLRVMVTAIDRYLADKGYKH